jgi:hypothetical protein
MRVYPIGRRQLAKREKQRRKEDGIIYKTFGCVCLILILLAVLI